MALVLVGQVKDDVRVILDWQEEHPRSRKLTAKELDELKRLCEQPELPSEEYSNSAFPLIKLATRDELGEIITALQEIDPDITNRWENHPNAATQLAMRVLMMHSMSDFM